MHKIATFAIATAIGLLGAGLTPITASTAEAKTATQIKQETRAKNTIAKNNAKRAAARTKSRK